MSPQYHAEPLAEQTDTLPFQTELLSSLQAATHRESMFTLGFISFQYQLNAKIDRRIA